MEPTESPVESFDSQPKSHWLIVTLSVVGVILLVGILFLYLQNQKLQKKVIDQQITSTIQTPSSTPETESLTSTPPDEMVGWKTYTNSSLGFEFKYPNTYSVLKETSGGIELGFTPPANSTPITYLIISTQKGTDLATILICPELRQFPCITKEGWNQIQPISEINISGHKAVSAYLSYGVDADYRIVQFEDIPTIELKMNVSGGGLDRDFTKILSTFKFL